MAISHVGVYVNGRSMFSDLGTLQEYGLKKSVLWALQTLPYFHYFLAILSINWMLFLEAGSGVCQLHAECQPRFGIRLTRLTKLKHISGHRVHKPI